MAVAKTPAPTPDLDIERRDQALAMLTAPAWKPEPGDILTARLVMTRRGGMDSEYGVYPILIFAPIDGFPFPTDQGYVAFHAFHTIVKAALVEYRPKPSENPVMTVRYTGRVQFGVTVQGDDGPVYVERKDKSDYEAYTVLMGDGSDIAVDDFDWDDAKPKPKSGDK